MLLYNTDSIAEDKPEYEAPVGEANDTPFYSRRTIVTSSSSDRRGYISQPHWHENVVILYIVKGSMDYFAQSRFFELKDNDMLLVRSCDVHAAKLKPGTECEYILVKFHPDILLSSTRETYDFRYVMPLVKNMGINMNLRFNCSYNKCIEIDLYDLMIKIHNAYKYKASAFEFRIKSYIHMIILNIINENADMLPSVSGAHVKGEYNAGSLKDLIEFVKSNYMNDITSKNAAKVCKMSYSCFARFMRKETGITFTQYLASVRLSYAEKDLLLTDLSISEIAEKNGYPDVAYFIRAFKKSYKITPSKYRKMQVFSDHSNK